MTWRELPHSAALSEFIAGYNGDCGETAELAALHVALGLALDGPELATIVQRDIAHGWASSNGSEPLSSIADDLALVGAQYTSDGFSQPPTFDWKGALAANAGVKPVILEFANAQALPGDETGVHYHFATALGGDPDTETYAFADGDNVAARSGQLVNYTVAQLEAAQPCGLILVEMANNGGGGVSGVPSGWKDDGKTLTAPNGMPVVQGFRDYVLANSWSADNWPLMAETGADPVEPGNPSLGAGTYQVFHLTKLSWTQARGVFVTWIGQDYLAMQSEISSLNTEVSQLKAQLDEDLNGKAMTALKAALAAAQ